MDRLLYAINDPVRREIVELLRGGELASSEIASHFKMTHSAISQHLKVLLQVGLVGVRKQGTRHWYSARQEGLSELRSVLLYLATCLTEE